MIKHPMIMTAASLGLGLLLSCSSTQPTELQLPHYDIVLSHDGHPDPDDNGAALAGFIAALRNVQEDAHQRMTLKGMIYGDTTEARQEGMLHGGDKDDNKGKANYLFYLKYTLPALTSLAQKEPLLTHFAHYDVTPETFNFSPTQISELSSGGQFLVSLIEAALTNTSTNIRVVDSAGGGGNTAAEAIAYLRKIGYSDAQIKEKFIIIQHSAWNWRKATEAQAQAITAAFTLRIEDQNKFTGYASANKIITQPESPKTEADFINRTSVEFVTAWKGAVFSNAETNPVMAAAQAGDTEKGIENLKGIRDVSDAGSHHFATDLEALDRHWHVRNNGLDVSVKKEPDVMNTPKGPLSYDKYQAPQLAADLF